MNTLHGSVDCKICNGEQLCPAWYANHAEQQVSFCYDLCSCTGRTNHRPGEREVTEEEYNCLKALWAKPAPSKDQSFQVAA